MKEEEDKIHDEEDEIVYIFGDGKPYFDDEFRDAMTPEIKNFLIDYYKEYFFNLEAETYRKIDETIDKNLTLYGEDIERILKHCRISDDDYDEEAINKSPKSKASWPEITRYNLEDVVDTSDNFFRDDPESELTEEQKLINRIDEFLDGFQIYKIFMNQANERLFSAARTFIENNAHYDLSLLSPEGFKSVQGRLDVLSERMFEELIDHLAKDIKGN